MLSDNVVATALVNTVFLGRTVRQIAKAVGLSVSTVRALPVSLFL